MGVGQKYFLIFFFLLGILFWGARQINDKVQSRSPAQKNVLADPALDSEDSQQLEKEIQVERVSNGKPLVIEALQE